MPAFFRAAIFRGRIKGLCLPGLNCYSCPSAIGACPIGSFQYALSSIRFHIETVQKQFGFYVLGFLTIVGSLAGRLPCGWLCPFGFIQELVHKIPCRKLKLPHFLTYFRYLVLAFFVILLPLLLVDEFGFGQTWFCKWICPAGTLEAGVPVVLLNPDIRSQVGFLFSWKVGIMILFLLLMIFFSRPFCRTACPLGAIWGLFNRASLFRMEVDEESCESCLACHRVCPVEIIPFSELNSPDCIRCLRCVGVCQYGALSYSFLKVKPKKPILENSL
ncbi:MAG: 4Fe-4S binding protein [Candidatus Jordarchaeum sp.]